MDLIGINAGNDDIAGVAALARPTHLWAAEDSYSGSVQASGALCSKRVNEP
jgi:hypothetical protein